MCVLRTVQLVYSSANTGGPVRWLLPAIDRRESGAQPPKESLIGEVIHIMRIFFSVSFSYSFILFTYLLDSFSD